MPSVIEQKTAVDRWSMLAELHQCQREGAGRRNGKSREESFAWQINDLQTRSADSNAASLGAPRNYGARRESREEAVSVRPPRRRRWHCLSRYHQSTTTPRWGSPFQGRKPCSWIQVSMKESDSPLPCTWQTFQRVDMGAACELAAWPPTKPPRCDASHGRAPDKQAQQHIYSRRQQWMFGCKVNPLHKRAP